MWNAQERRLPYRYRLETLGMKRTDENMVVGFCLTLSIDCESTLRTSTDYMYVRVYWHVT